jgi:hypothetical protein
MKLRYYYKIDHNKMPITGSNIRRKSSPGKQWKEILDVCKFPVKPEATGGPRFFIQLDHNNKPIDGSLIKRFGLPEMVREIKYLELPKGPISCYSDITWDFTATTTGSLVIKINGIEEVNVTATDDGAFRPKYGDLIEITVNNTVVDAPEISLDVEGAKTYSITDDVASVTFSFNYNGGAVTITATISDTTA